MSDIRFIIFNFNPQNCTGEFTNIDDEDEDRIDRGAMIAPPNIEFNGNNRLIFEALQCITENQVKEILSPLMKNLTMNQVSVHFFSLCQLGKKCSRKMEI